MSSPPYDKPYTMTSFTPDVITVPGKESYVIRAENMWLRFNEKQTFAQGYTGHKQLNEVPDNFKITGSIEWTDNSKLVTGTGTAFIDEIREGNWIFANTADNTRVLLVVEEVLSNSSFLATGIPPNAGNSADNYVMPVIDAIGTQRATYVMGRVTKFPKGHYLGVGKGEFRLNGTPLNSTFVLQKQPQFALFNPVTGQYTINDVGIDFGGAEPQISIAEIALAYSQMRAGSYNIRVYAYNTETLGHSQPSDVIDPVAVTAGKGIEVTFLNPMADDQNAYIILSTEFQDNSSANIEARYMGPWYKVKIVTQDEIAAYSGGGTGREAGKKYGFAFSDSEINTSDNIISFDNDTPREAEFVTLLNGIPIYFSCLGKGTIAKKEGKSPGPCAIPSKPSNPEAVFLNKSFTTTDADLILGVINSRGRIYVPCQNSLQNVILTTVDVEPIAFRSYWATGFRNPYNVCFYKDYIIGFSTQGFVRGVAGGDTLQEEVNYAIDLKQWASVLDCGKELSAYDPKNKAICHFFSAYEKRSGYWVTLVLPFLIEGGVFSYPIILSRPDQDFIVSGVATVGQELAFVAGGMDAANAFTMDTYIFDGGDNLARDWNITFCYSADDEFNYLKNHKKASVLGKFYNPAQLQTYTANPDEEFSLTDLFTGANPDETIELTTTGGNLGLKNFNFTDTNKGLYNTIRIHGTHNGTQVDEIHNILMKLESNSSEV